MKPVLWHRTCLFIQALGSNGHFAILNWTCKLVLKKYDIRKSFGNLILNFKISQFSSPLQREHPHLKEVIFHPRRDSTHNKRSLISPLCDYKRNLQLNGVSTRGTDGPSVAQSAAVLTGDGTEIHRHGNPCLPPPSRQQEIAHQRYFRKPRKREKLCFLLSSFFFKCTCQRCFQEMGGWRLLPLSEKSSLCCRDLQWMLGPDQPSKMFTANFIALPLKTFMLIFWWIYFGVSFS